MATILQLNDADFSGKGLPVITPLLSLGLIGAFRPAKSLLNTVDLSNSGATVSLAGAPTFTDNYVECDAKNGLVTNIKETKNITICVVARAFEKDSQQSGFYAGSYTGARGVSLLNGATSTQAQVASKTLATGSYKNELHSVATRDQAPMGEWQYIAMSIDTDAGIVTTFNPNAGQKIVNAAAGGQLIADRDGLDRLLYIGRPAYTTESYRAQIQIAEVLFYNRALTNSEITEAYNLSKKTMASKNIII